MTNETIIINVELDTKDFEVAIKSMQQESKDVVQNILREFSLLKTIGDTTSGVTTFMNSLSTLATLSKTTSMVTVTGFAAIKTATDLTTASQIALNTVMSAMNLGTFALFSVVAVAALTAVNAVMKNSREEMEQMKQAGETVGEAFNGFFEGIQNASSKISGFADNLFISPDEQGALQENLATVQSNLTGLLTKAKEERGLVLQEDINQFKTYFEELQALHEQELSIEEARAKAISQQAMQAAGDKTASYEQYKATAEQWIATAQEQRDTEVGLVEEQTTTSLALLNERYGELAVITANMSGTQLEGLKHQYSQEEQARIQAFNAEYEQLMAQKETKVTAANEEFGAVNAAFADGMARRLELNLQDTEAYKIYNEAKEDAAREYDAFVKGIRENELIDEEQKNYDLQNLTKHHEDTMKSLWANYTKNLSDEDLKRTGEYSAIVTNAELFGGELSASAKKTNDLVLSAYENLPDKTRETMENAMKPMLQKMQDHEPVLFAKASTIAGGIISRFRSIFDEHSPSRVMREIFQYLMQGAEIGLKDEEGNLYQQVADIGSSVVQEMQGITAAQQASASMRFAEAAPVQTVDVQGFDMDLSQLATLHASQQQDVVVNLTAQLDGREIYRNQQKIAKNWGTPTSSVFAYEY